MVMGRRDDALSWPGEPVRYEVDGFVGWMPWRYHDMEMYLTLHTADFDAAARALPSEVLTPVRWLDGRALVAVSVCYYRSISWSGPDGAAGWATPYGEVGVSVVTSIGAAPRALPVLLNNMKSVILHLPVTTREARDVGRGVLGLPKFLADMDFTESPSARSVRVADRDQHILTLTVYPSGPALTDSSPIVSFSSVGGELREVVAPCLMTQQYRLGGGGGQLELGAHPVADQIRDLGVAPRPLLLLNNLRSWMVLPPPGKRIGDAREVPCFAGRDDDVARLTVTYPGTGPLDLYAAPPAIRQPRPAA
jgi:hypothetical protein